MNRITNYEQLADDITAWIKDYATTNNIKSLVVGVSGGIDSAVVSTLCAKTGLDTFCAVIDIYNDKSHTSRAIGHCAWLEENYKNSYYKHTNMDDTMMTIMIPMSASGHPTTDHLAANTKSRLRMITLYNYAGASHGIVVGTGNKVEDFGIGFATKGGDLQCDISPIADLYKTEVRELGRYLGINEEIINAKPSDGLWADGRTDEQQIGCSYTDLEAVMAWQSGESVLMNDDLKPAFEIYNRLHKQNQHKMNPIPVYKADKHITR